jgi:3-deoxy-manno-octulosonate cytidylyltransferase (CMP-KDO synthetase)
MVQHVYQRALKAGARSVIVATDDDRIASACRAFGADVALTDPAHPSGTDRLAEVARARGLEDGEVVVNVQGDEPLLPSENIAAVAALLARDPGAAIATLSTPVLSLTDYLDPNVVKVVVNRDGRALYFSRAPIPWQRDAAQHGIEDERRYAGAQRHIGLYAYRVGALKTLAGLAPTALEMAERLEQLRALEHGLAIAVAPAAVVPGPGVDTPEDLERVAVLMAAGGLT